MDKIGKPLAPLRIPQSFKGKKYPEIGRKYKKWGRPLSDVDRLEKFAKGATEDYTLPERIIEKVLIITGLPFESQVPIPGASARVDFLVLFGAPGIVIRVQGLYWHTLGNRRATDLIQMLKLKGKGYGIWDAWETEIYAHALNGSVIPWVKSELAIAS